MESAEHGHFKAHMNLAFTFPPLPSHGEEEIDAEEPSLVDPTAT